jgi:hypothetical protein
MFVTAISLAQNFVTSPSLGGTRNFSIRRFLKMVSGRCFIEPYNSTCGKKSQPFLLGLKNFSVTPFQAAKQTARATAPAFVRYKLQVEGFPIFDFIGNLTVKKVRDFRFR